MVLIITFITDLRFIILRYKFGYIHRVEFASKFLENTLLNHFIQIIIMGGIILAGVILKYSKTKGVILIILLSLYSYLIGEKFWLFFCHFMFFYYWVFLLIQLLNNVSFILKYAIFFFDRSSFLLYKCCFNNV